MKNNKGIGRFELLTMLLIAAIAVCLVLWYFIGVANRERYTTMKKDAVSFNQSVLTNVNNFTNDRVVYLGQLVTGGYIKTIKNPFTGKDCSISESKVEMENGKSKTTLRCGNYLIDAFRITDSYEEIPIYKVTEWSETKPKGKYEEKSLFNCLDGGKEKYDSYLEEAYLVAQINHDYGSNHYDASTIKNECKVVRKIFYRTKKLIK